MKLKNNRPAKPPQKRFRDDSRLRQEQRQAMQRFGRHKILPFTRRGI